MSCRLADEPGGDFGGHGGLVGARLQQAHERGLDGRRVAGEVVDAEAGEGAEPVEGLGDAGGFFQVLAAESRTKPTIWAARRGPAPGARAAMIASSVPRSGKSI